VVLGGVGGGVGGAVVVMLPSSALFSSILRRFYRG